MPEKMTRKSQAKIKPYSHNIHYLSIFNYKKASCEQTYTLKF